MLYEVLGDMWVVQRNPYPEDDLLASPGAVPRWWKPCTTAWARSRSAARRCRMANATARCSKVLEATRLAVQRFEAQFEQAGALRKKARKLLGRHTAGDNISSTA